MKDRDFLKRYPDQKLPDLDPSEKKRLFLFDWFRNSEDAKIAKLMLNYFAAVQDRWPTAWNAHMDYGLVLNRTTGYLALMKFFRDACLYLNIEPEIPAKNQFANLFAKVKLSDNDFTKQRFIPGTTGQRDLYLKILNDTQVPKAP